MPRGIKEIATDLSGIFQKQTLRGWLVLGGFPDREPTKKRLLDPAHISVGASEAAVALPGEAEIHHSFTSNHLSAYGCASTSILSGNCNKTLT